MYQWKSFGVGVDVSATYVNPKSNLVASLMYRNIGTQIKKYRKDNNESLDSDLQLGVSKKLAKAPFRLLFHAVNLNNWNLQYENPNSPTLLVDPLTGDSIKENKWEGYADNLMRHVVFGLEFVPSRNFNVRVGYNYKMRQEMKLATKTAMIGFSWGFGVRVNKFYLSYGRGIQHLAGPKNGITISTNINDFIKS